VFRAADSVDFNPAPNGEVFTGFAVKLPDSREYRYLDLYAIAFAANSLVKRSRCCQARIGDGCQQSCPGDALGRGLPYTGQDLCHATS
jgi:hypothetical protein